MVRIIRSHNQLNGTLFSAIEFGLMALFLVPFAVYCLGVRQLAVGLVLGGIGLNCLPVVWYGLRTFLKREDKPGTIWNRQAREQLIAENPHMLRDTFALTGAVLVPFLVLAVVLFQSRRENRDE